MEEKPFDVITRGTILLDVFMKSDNFVRIPVGEFARGTALEHCLTLGDVSHKAF